jgi:hypothetical protein
MHEVIMHKWIKLCKSNAQLRAKHMADHNHNSATVIQIELEVLRKQKEVLVTARPDALIFQIKGANYLRHKSHIPHVPGNKTRKYHLYVRSLAARPSGNS